MTIDPSKPAQGVTAVKADLRANLQAAKDGIDGAGGIVTTGTPFTINAASFGDAVDYWLVWNAAGAASVTLATGVPFGKALQVTQLGAGVVNVAATNLLTGAIATTAQYDSLVFRSLGTGDWVRVQTAA